MTDPTIKYLIPTIGCLVRDPITKEPLPKEGKTKPWIGVEGRYWRRRVRFGEATIGKKSSPSISKSEISEIGNKRRK